MYSKQNTRQSKTFIVRIVAVMLLVSLLSFSSFVTVMANTVEANVIDGESSYQFSMITTKLDDIVAVAEKKGLAPLGELDVAEIVGNTTTVNVRRGAKMELTQVGKKTELVIFKGDTLEKSLLDNNIILKEKDVVIPERDTVITGDIDVEIKRFCQVVVVADGKTQSTSLTGGTVKAALNSLKITLGEKDTANYSLDEPLFEKMSIRVARSYNIRIIADSETKNYEVSALTVESAIKAAKIELGKEDRINFDKTEKIAEGMEIVIRRVTVKEETETQAINYETTYKESDEMYKNESSVEKSGVKGEKEIEYLVTYIDGVAEERKYVSEKITKEPVNEIVVVGTKAKPNAASGVTAGTDGTFVDHEGNTVSYSRLISGNCTAYYGGTMTSIGLTPAYGIVAVDPKIIPYGTKMYICSPDGSIVYGYCVAGDTGGAAMAGDIVADLYYDTYEECLQIGRRTMNVYIL